MLMSTPRNFHRRSTSRKANVNEHPESSRKANDSRDRFIIFCSTSRKANVNEHPESSRKANDSWERFLKAFVTLNLSVGDG